MGDMAKNMETIGITGVIWGLYWENGKENGNYYNGFYRGSMGFNYDPEWFWTGAHGFKG